MELLILACGAGGFYTNQPSFNAIKPPAPQRLGSFVQVFARGVAHATRIYATWDFRNTDCRTF
jgi:hypothetical protein